MKCIKWIDDNSKEVIVSVSFEDGNNLVDYYTNFVKAEYKAIKRLEALYKTDTYKGNATEQTPPCSPFVIGNSANRYRMLPASDRVKIYRNTEGDIDTSKIFIKLK